MEDQYLGVHQVVFHRSWVDISGVCKELSKRCSRFIACEHPADEDIKCTHVHCLLDGFETKNKVPVEGIRAVIPEEYKGRGQYVIMQKTQKPPRVYYRYKELAIYIIKGNAENIRYLKNVSPVEEKELAEQWINHSDHKADSDSSKVKTHWDIIQDIVKDIEPESKTIQVGSKLLTSKRVSFDEVYYKTIQHLNRNKIKTHVKEIERFVVSVMRITQCDELRESLKLQIHKNIFGV